jgi:hypothetical protein
MVVVWGEESERAWKTNWSSQSSGSCLPWCCNGTGLVSGTCKLAQVVMLCDDALRRVALRLGDAVKGIWVKSTQRNQRNGGCDNARYDDWCVIMVEVYLVSIEGRRGTWWILQRYYRVPYAAFEIGIADGKKHFGTSYNAVHYWEKGITCNNKLICRQNEDDYNKIMT